jgi:hypothetical protein
MLTPHQARLGKRLMQGRNTAHREDSFTSLSRFVKTDLSIKHPAKSAHIRP